MSDGLYTAMSGGMGTSKQLDIVSVNLANIDTTGYKKDKTIFEKQLADIEFDLLDYQAEGVDMPEKVLPVDKHNVFVAETYTDHSQGAVKKTDNPLDVAINGDGFFKIQTPQGIKYTRVGSFSISKDQTLVTMDGYPVLDQDEREITIDRGGEVSINQNGTVFSNNVEMGRLAFVKFENPEQLEKVAKTMYINSQNLQEQPSDGTVIQGFLETSNVNPIEEMVNLIQLNRTFEFNTRVIESFSEMNRQATTDVGRVG